MFEQMYSNSHTHQIFFHFFEIFFGLFRNRITFVQVLTFINP
jgi:hypothetical protein